MEKHYFKKVAFHNLGCKVNSYELDIMRQILRDEGYEEVPFNEQADIYVVNTCTVTNIADRKSRQMLHRAKKQNREAVVIAAGCYVETDPERQLTDPGHTRAYIKIQDGCNQFCSYCIIPFARGRIRSRAEEEILREVKALVEKGIREIVLTGIHVSSYGLDFGHEGPVPFDPVRSGKALLDLMTKLNAIEGLERIRLSSLEPRIMTEPFIAALSKLRKVCPHFHLSLQSGCDATLRRMNRRYTTEEYARSVQLLRQYYDRPAITTDVIVGFPGETQEEFETTCAFLEKIRFYEIHVFRYSRRSGTVADKMPDQIPEQIKAERSDRLLAMTAEQAQAFRRQFAGERETILLEEICEKEGKGYWTGSTMRYVTGAVPVPETPQTPPENDAADLHPGVLLDGTFTGEEISLSRGTACLFRI